MKSQGCEEKPGLYGGRVFSRPPTVYPGRMAEILLILLVTAFFLALKAIEHRGHAPMYTVTSIGAWIAFGVWIILTLVT